MYIYIYVCVPLQIQNQHFSRVCSNTRGLHSEPEFFQYLSSLNVVHADAFFPGELHRFCMSDTVGHELAGTTVHAIPPKLQKNMCFLPMSLHKLHSNL